MVLAGGAEVLMVLVVLVLAGAEVMMWAGNVDALVVLRCWCWLVVLRC